MTEQQQAIEVNRLHAKALEIKKVPIRGWWSLRAFATRVTDLIHMYWALKSDHHLVERIFAESGSPLESAAADYKEVRRMQGVLSRCLNDEREGHGVTKDEMRVQAERDNITIKDLNSKIAAHQRDCEKLHAALSKKDIEFAAEATAHRETRRKLAFAEEALRQNEKARATFRAHLEAQVDEMKKFNLAMADRIHGQHELLGAMAEKKDDKSDQK